MLVAGIPDTRRALDWPFSEKDAPSPILHPAKLRLFTTNTSLAVGGTVGGRIMSSGKVKLRFANCVRFFGGLSRTPAQFLGVGFKIAVVALLRWLGATHRLLVGTGAWACAGAINAACAASTKPNARIGPRKIGLKARFRWMIRSRSGLSIMGK